MTQLKQPVMAHSLLLEVEADNVKELANVLHRIAKDLALNGPTESVICGGYDYGYMLKYKHDPEMTHDKFYAELEAFMDWQKQQPPIIAVDDSEGGQHD
jgi:hypothetical protein